MAKIEPPWWCCFGWHPRSLICLSDNILHAQFKKSPEFICDWHDRLIVGKWESEYSNTAAKKPSMTEWSEIKRKLEERKEIDGG